MVNKLLLLSVLKKQIKVIEEKENKKNKQRYNSYVKQ